jgi:hypothetical protein
MFWLLLCVARVAFCAVGEAFTPQSLLAASSHQQMLVNVGPFLVLAIGSSSVIYTRHPLIFTSIWFFGLYLLP